jgi:uncharacterized protein
MPDFIVGSPVRGDDFLFREECMNMLWESIEKHNVLLIAPRRIGKTSVMYRMLDFPLNDWRVIHQNVEDLKTPGDFFITLVDSIRVHQLAFFKDTIAKGWDLLKGLVSGIESVEAYEFKIQLRKKENFRENWELRATQLIDRIIHSNTPLLFVIDELPDMLNAMHDYSEADYLAFLHWFRKIRDRSLRARLRWLLGGSVNLISVLDKKGNVKLVNDLKPEVLKPFSKQEVNDFITQMFKKEKVAYDPGVIDKIIDLLGSPIPYFLQMFSQELCREWRRNPEERIAQKTAIDVFNKTLLGEMARDKLQHYRSRIEIHYAAEEREAACHLLNKIAISPNGLTQKALFTYYRLIEERKTTPRSGPALLQAFHRLLLHLQSDFYIEGTSNERFDFASKLIKTWWKKYYGFEFGDE